MKRILLLAACRRSWLLLGFPTPFPYSKFLAGSVWWAGGPSPSSIVRAVWLNMSKQEQKAKNDCGSRLSIRPLMLMCHAVSSSTQSVSVPPHHLALVSRARGSRVCFRAAALLIVLASPR